MPSLFHPADLLIPHNEYLPAWSVVACDQFTSEPDYWQAVEVITTDKPSTYHITLPEIYLSQQTDERIAAINNTMLTYQNSDLFCEFPASLILPLCSQIFNNYSAFFHCFQAPVSPD